MKGYCQIKENMSKVIIHQDVIFNECDFQRDSTTVNVNEGVTVSDHEKGVVSEEEEVPMEQSEQHNQKKKRTKKKINTGILKNRESRQSGMEFMSM